ncbi:MAG: glycosyltransferase, partial [Armatimonadetes bacterium]|nr:glycosyltransferase [Armatimonadota bacterium]
GALRGELDLPAGSPLVGTCGRMVPIKNQALLVEAAARVHAQRPEVQFCIIGDGELHAELAARIETLGLGEVFHLVGWRSDTPPLMADLDLFVLTSLNEGTPVTLIEAAAAGVAAVSTSVGGVPDLVREGETGWLVPSEDAAALATAILTALADPAACEVAGQRAQAEVLERFHYRRLVRDLAELYRSLLPSR